MGAFFFFYVFKNSTFNLELIVNSPTLVTKNTEKSLFCHRKDPSCCSFITAPISLPLTLWSLNPGSPHLFSITTVLSFQECYVSRTIQYITFGIAFFSHSVCLFNGFFPLSLPFFILYLFIVLSVSLCIISFQFLWDIYAITIYWYQHFTTGS